MAGFDITKESVKVFMPNLIILLFILGIVSLIVFLHLARDVNAEDLEDSLLVNRLIYSRECFGYNGERFYPGIINLDRFNENVLEECTRKDNIGYRLELMEINGESIKSVNVGKLYSFLDFCGENTNFSCYFHRNFVLLDDRGELRNAILDIRVVILSE